MSQVFNFSAGPAMLPTEVMQQAQAEFCDWQGLGTSVMEVSHRCAAFVALMEQAEQDVRDLLAVPDNYKVLFLQGGATAQFSMVPLNLLGDKTRADYINTGAWSKKAIAEAKRYCQVNVAASAEDSGFSAIPAQSEWRCDPEAAYLHYTPNETIGGLEFHSIPEVGEVPLVADMSSTLFSRPIDVSRFALIYAGAQKNIGPSGLTLVIVREDLIGQVAASAPASFDYALQAKHGSMYNTPPTFACYLASLVFRWLLQQGGVSGMAERNQQKAQRLYQYIDQSDFYRNPIAPADRSWMNVPFVLADAQLDKRFLQESEAAGLQHLKGHRSVGGMRASLYNAMPLAGVEALIAFMQGFAQRYG